MIKKKMLLDKKEMETILEMYHIVCGEGQETNDIKNLVKRVREEIQKWGSNE